MTHSQEQEVGVEGTDARPRAVTAAATSPEALRISNVDTGAALAGPRNPNSGG